MFVFVCVANFEAKYEQLGLLGKGGFGSVYAGNRRTDHFQVSLPYIFSHHTYKQSFLPALTKVLVTLSHRLQSNTSPKLMWRLNQR